MDTAILYWSERGEVCCKAHAPMRGSDTWKWDRWRKISATDLAAAAAMGNPLACETCTAKAARAATVTP